MPCLKALKEGRSYLKEHLLRAKSEQPLCKSALTHQNRTIAIASDFRVDGAKSPEILQKEEVLGSEIAARNRKSLATFHRTLKSQCSIALSCFRNRCDFSGVRDGHRNRKSQTSLRFRCAKKSAECPLTSSLTCLSLAEGKAGQLQVQVCLVTEREIS